MSLEWQKPPEARSCEHSLFKSKVPLFCLLIPISREYLPGADN